MNNSFVLQQADAMAQRIEKEVGSDPTAQFQRAWQLTYCRAPTDTQTQSGVAFLAEQSEIVAGSATTNSKTEPPKSAHVALSNLCQALVISNGFLYVE
jgi:hypothetical protein